MMAAHIQALLLPLGWHLLASLMLAFIGWKLLLIVQPQWKISWLTPVILGALITLYNALNSLTMLKQNIALSAVTTSPNTRVLDREIKSNKLKEDFLAAVDAFIAKPKPMTSETKAAFFKQFSSLFPNGPTDREAYRSAIAQIFECQRSFYEDALEAVKTKKAVKSLQRETCQNQDGLFFNRPKLIPADVAKVNDTTIETLAAGKKLTQNGMEMNIDAKFLQNGIDEQNRRLKVLDDLFQ